MGARARRCAGVRPRPLARRWHRVAVLHPCRVTAAGTAGETSAKDRRRLAQSAPSKPLRAPLCSLSKRRYLWHEELYERKPYDDIFEDPLAMFQKLRLRQNKQAEYAAMSNASREATPVPAGGSTQAMRTCSIRCPTCVMRSGIQCTHSLPCSLDPLEFSKTEYINRKQTKLFAFYEKSTKNRNFHRRERTKNSFHGSAQKDARDSRWLARSTPAGSSRTRRHARSDPPAQSARR